MARKNNHPLGHEVFKISYICETLGDSQLRLSSILMSIPLPTLRIAIAGAGMGGLTTALALAHQGFQHIDLYELASDLGFVGAGIQVAPNMSRQLQRLGVWGHMAEDAVDLAAASVRGMRVAALNCGVQGHVAERYGQPHRVSAFRACERAVRGLQSSGSSCNGSFPGSGCRDRFRRPTYSGPRAR